MVNIFVVLAVLFVAIFWVASSAGTKPEDDLDESKIDLEEPSDNKE